MKKPGGENNESKIRKVELVSKTSTIKKIWAYSKPSRKHSWQKLECTLENSHRKKSKHIPSQVKSVQMNIKQHVLGASKNRKKPEKVKKEHKRN